MSYCRTNATTSRRQGQSREGWSEGSPSAKVRVDGASSMCYWKQWRWVRTKVRNLLALGTSKRQAILTAISS